MTGNNYAKCGLSHLANSISLLHKNSNYHVFVLASLNVMLMFVYYTVSFSLSYVCMYVCMYVYSFKSWCCEFLYIIQTTIVALSSSCAHKQ